MLAAASLFVAVPAASAVEQPFAVAAPQNGSAVDSTTPVFSGTGTTGNTVTLTYSGQQLGGYTAGTTVVDDAGNWSVGTNFDKANPGETETRVRVVETTPGGIESATFFITITFPTAPVEAAVFTLESPQDGETRNDFLNIVHFIGQGNAGNTVSVTYFDGRGGLASAGTAQVDQNGRFDVFATFRDLPPGQDFANTFTIQTTPSGDRVSNEIGRTIFFAVPPVDPAPFTVTNPQNGSTVDSTSPAFSGTGAPGDTVTLSYGGQQLGTYVAGTTTIDADGNWVIPTTDFTSANFGETTTRVRVEATQPSGAERPNGTFFITITFPQAPVAEAEFTLTSPLEGETRDDLLNIVPFVGTGEPGNTVTVRYFDGRGGLAEAGVGEVRADGSFRILSTFRELPPGQDFANTFTTQTNPAGAAVAADIGRTIFFANPPVALFPFTVVSPQNFSTVDTLTPAYTGTGAPGDTVTVSYSGQGLLSYVAGTTTVGADGTWTIEQTDFSMAPFGDTEIRTRVVETTPDGVEVPNGTLFITITFPSAPAVEALDAPVLDEPVVDGQTVTFSGTADPGATVEVAVVDAPLAGADPVLSARLAAPATLTATVTADGTWSVEAEFDAGDYAATATQFTGDGADRSAPSNTVDFAVLAAPVDPAPGTGGQPGDGGADGDGTDAGGAPAASSVDRGSLAATGSDASGVWMLGMLMIAVGALVVIARRVRASTGS